MPASRWKNFGDSLGQLAALVALVGGCLVAAWQFWPSIDGWHQRRLAVQLGERIAALADDQVKIPLHQLASIGTPALGPLVEAAASERDAVARIAQQEIDIAFSACLMQLREGHGEQPAEALVELAMALANNVGRFGPAGQRWVENLALRMIDVSDRLPLHSATSLLSATSRVLDGIPPRGPRQRSVDSVLELPPLESFAVAIPLPLDIQTFALSSESVLSAPGLREPSAPSLLDPPSGLPDYDPSDQEPSTDEPLQEPGEIWNPQWIGVRSIPPPLPLAGDASLSVRVREGQSHTLLDVPTPLEFQRRLSDLRRQSTAMLFEQFVGADKFGAGAIRTVLAERGLDAKEVDAVARIKMADEAERLRLIDEVSQLPAAAARRLLRLLLSDPSGEVRLRALTTLATANDPKLSDLARTIATEDQDPRVADLASKLLRQ